MTISGRRFAGTNAVSFGGIPGASFTVNVAGASIVAVTPPEAGAGVQSVDVSATTAAGTSTLAAAFTYAAPVVTSISPVSGTPTGGTTVVISGTFLYGATAVHFGTSSATIKKMSATSLTVVSPPGSGAVDVTVTDSAGTSAVVAGDLFTY